MSFSRENFAVRAQATLARHKLEAQIANAAAQAKGEIVTAVFRWYIQAGRQWLAQDLVRDVRRGSGSGK